MKKILIGVGIFLAFIILVATVLPFVIDINALVASQIPTIEKQINRDISIGDVKLKILTGLGAEIKNVKIANNPDFRKADFVSIDRLTATVQLLPLLKKEVLISSVSIEKPLILIEKDAKNNFNFSDIIAPKETKQETGKKPEPDAESENSLATLAKIHVSEISIRDGNFQFFDASGGGRPKEISLDKFNLTLKAVSLAQKIGIDLETDIYASPKAGHVKISGDLGPIGTEPTPGNITVDLTIALQDINLSHLASYVKGINIKSGAIDMTTSVKGRLKEKLQCRVDLEWDQLDMNMNESSPQSAPQKIFVNGPWRVEADVSGAPNEPVAVGKISLDKSVVRYGKLFDKPSDAPLNIDFDVAVKGGRQELKKIVARVGPLEATVNGSVDQGPVLNIDVQSNSFSLDKLISLSPQTSQSLPKDLQLTNTVRLSASADGSLDDMKFNAGVNATDENIVFGNMFQKGAGTPLTVDVSGRLKKDALQVDNLKFVLSKLIVTGAADVRNFAEPLIDGKIALAPTSLDALAPILPPLKPYALQGSLALKDARFKGKIDELKNLKGVSGSLTIQDGRAASTELGKNIEKIQASVDVANNTIQVKNTSFKIGDSDMNITATIRNPTKPTITFDLTSSYLDVDALLPPPSQEKKGTGPKPQPTGEAAEKSKAPELRAVGKVAIKKCKYNKLVIENVTADLVYGDAVATLKNLGFDTFDGNITTSTTVDLTDMAAPQWSAALSTRDINTNATLSQFTTLQNVIYGTFNSNLSLEGKGSDWASISKNLSASGSSDLLNGKLANINVLDAIGQSLLKVQGLGKLAQTILPDIQTTVKETVFQNLSGKFNIQKGKILLDAINMSTQDFKLSGNGAIGLDKTLDLNTLVVLSQSISERLQKDNTLKYLLSKDQLLEIPCTVTGDILKPRINANGSMLSDLLKNAATKAISDQIQTGIGNKLGDEADKLLKGIFKEK